MKQLTETQGSILINFLGRALNLYESDYGKAKEIYIDVVKKCLGELSLREIKFEGATTVTDSSNDVQSCVGLAINREDVMFNTATRNPIFLDNLSVNYFFNVVMKLREFIINNTKFTK